MNYLIATFDGLGDGFIYYPLFKELVIQEPVSMFFCTGNAFFLDPEIKEELIAPLGLIDTDPSFAKFPRERWTEILNFLNTNNIQAVINLRFIGPRYEKDYYDFKNHVEQLGKKITFFDITGNHDEDNQNQNVRSVNASILMQAIGKNIKPDFHWLSRTRRQTGLIGSVLINPHTRGDFKRWQVTKFAQLIDALCRQSIPVEIYEGHNAVERAYTEEIISCLDSEQKNKVIVVRAKGVKELIDIVRHAALLVSVDSGMVHIANSAGVPTLGIYVSTSPILWGGIGEKFHYVASPHMITCANFFAGFGMCMNGKRKCAVIEKHDDIEVDVVLDAISKLYAKEN